MEFGHKILKDYLQKRDLLLPGITTIVENVNAASNETREQIHRAQ